LINMARLRNICTTAVMLNHWARFLHQTVGLMEEIISSSDAIPTRVRVKTPIATAAGVVTPSPVA